MTWTRAAVVLAFLCACAHAKRDPVSDARRALARQLVDRGDARAALPVVDALCREHPGDAGALALRGIVYRDLGLVEEADRDLRAAIVRDGNGAEAHSALAVLYDRQRRHDEAALHHARAVELDPDEPRYLNNLGFSLFARGKAREAIAAYERGLRLAPADARLRNNLGFAYAVTGDFTRAAQSFAMGGRPAEASNNLGVAYELKGMLARAFERYAEAVRLDPALATARSNLAAAAEALGRPVPADLPATPVASGQEEGAR
jgi:Flp pilus assembly protein TadD